MATQRSKQGKQAVRTKSSREDALLRSLRHVPKGAVDDLLFRGVQALRPGHHVVLFVPYVELDAFAEHKGFTPEDLAGVPPLATVHFDYTTQERLESHLARWRRFRCDGVEFESVEVEIRFKDCPERWLVVVGPDQAATDAFLRELSRFSMEVRGQVLVFQAGYWQKSEALHRAIRAVGFDSLVLPPGLAERIRDDFLGFRDAKAAYAKHGVPWKRGVLFLGPPGNGKTHCIKAVVNALGWPALYVRSLVSRSPDFHSPIHDVFKRARELAPCLLVFEDLDSMVGPKTLSYFLNELDGFASNTGIVVLASTNYPERLDPALVHRPSRFDVKYTFDLPAPPERRRFLASWNRRADGASHFSDEDLDRLAEDTDGFSFAFLKELLVSSLMQWMTAGASRRFGEVARELVPTLRLQLRKELDAPPPPPEQPVLPTFDGD